MNAITITWTRNCLRDAYSDMIDRPQVDEAETLARRELVELCGKVWSDYRPIKADRDTEADEIEYAARRQDARRERILSGQATDVDRWTESTYAAINSTLACIIAEHEVRR